MNAENASASIALAICGMSTAVSALSRPITPTRKVRSYLSGESGNRPKARELRHLRGRPNGPTSVERHLFKASHPKCPRCSSGQINATSLHEGAAVIDPDSDASTALLGCNCDMGAEGLRAMSGSHRPRIHSFAGCGSTTAIAIMRGYACLGKYRRRCKGKGQSNKCRTDHSLTFHDLPSCVTLHHLPSSARLFAAL